MTNINSLFIHIQVLPKVFNYRKLITMLLILMSPWHVKIASSRVVKYELTCNWASCSFTWQLFWCKSLPPPGRRTKGMLLTFHTPSIGNYILPVHLHNVTCKIFTGFSEWYCGTKENQEPKKKGKKRKKTIYTSCPFYRTHWLHHRWKRQRRHWVRWPAAMGRTREQQGAWRAADALVLGPRPFPRGCRHGLR